MLTQRAGDGGDGERLPSVLARARRRPDAPRRTCSNACRQRAYRERRPAEAALR